MDQVHLEFPDWALRISRVRDSLWSESIANVEVTAAGFVLDFTDMYGEFDVEDGFARYEGNASPDLEDALLAARVPFVSRRFDVNGVHLQTRAARHDEVLQQKRTHTISADDVLRTVEARLLRDPPDVKAALASIKEHFDAGQRQWRSYDIGMEAAGMWHGARGAVRALASAIASKRDCDLDDVAELMKEFDIAALGPPDGAAVRLRLVAASYLTRAPVCLDLLAGAGFTPTPSEIIEVEARIAPEDRIYADARAHWAALAARIAAEHALQGAACAAPTEPMGSP